MIVTLLKIIVGVIIMGLASYHIIGIKPPQYEPEHEKDYKNFKIKVIIAVGFLGFIMLNLMYMFIPKTSEVAKIMYNYNLAYHIPIFDGIANMVVWFICSLAFGYYINRTAKA